MSDALPALSTPALIPLNDEGAGDAVNLRSVSCNDLAAAAKHNQFQISNGGLDKNYNNHIASSTHSIRNLSSSKPGIILTRSLEVPINLINDAEKPWNSLHTITPSRPQDSHPFSGLLTSQLQCTNCNWKVSYFFKTSSEHEKLMMFDFLNENSLQYVTIGLKAYFFHCHLTEDHLVGEVPAYPNYFHDSLRANL